MAPDARGDLLYVALSTTDRLAVIDVSGGPARPLVELPMCGFPDALAPLPGGGVVVACRFDPGLRVVTRVEGALAKDRFHVRVVDAGPEHGHRGIAVDRDGRFAYVASPPRGGVKVVDLSDRPRPPDFTATGVFPGALRLLAADPRNGLTRDLLLVSNLIGHTVTVHEIRNDGGLSPALQTITTEAPVLDLAVVPAGSTTDDLCGALLLLTHEDRPLSRERFSVEGLDSVVLVLPRAKPDAALPFVDSGPGKRTAINLTERNREALVGLDAIAVEASTGRLALVGAGTDNVLVVPARTEALRSAPAIPVGANPSAVVFLPGGRVVTADRLSDTITFVPAPRATVATAGATSDHAVETLNLGIPERPRLTERGELLFFSRALVPNNVATGPLSIYTCAACHADGHIDGRRHPSKRNRFFSMTKTCRGLQGTEPFLSLGFPETFAAFADNIVGTHAQGRQEAPDTFDRYPVRLRVRVGTDWSEVTLSPDDVRAALAVYMARIPVEPSPFVAPGRLTLTEAERRGLRTFRESCGGCHRLAPATGKASVIRGKAVEPALLAGRLVLTSAGRHDVGTPVLGEGGNNPPSLRGAWAAAPYFSDGSAATLEDVIRRTVPGAFKIHAAENAKLAPAFSAAARADLLAFLRVF